MEHIDERFDRLVLADATSISDRYVSGDGTCFRSFHGNGRGGVNFRVFVPASGHLIFDGGAINMFGLDSHLLSLRANIEEGRIELAERLAQATAHLPEGRRGNIFGGQQFVNLLPDDYQQRVEAFMTKRAEHGQPIQAQIVFSPEPGDVAAPLSAEAEQA